MDELRLTLLVLGLGVVAFVYWHSRRQTRRREARREPRREPALDDARIGPDEDTASLPQVEEDASGPDTKADLTVDDGEVDASEEETDDQLSPIEQKIVTLRLVARGEEHFGGEQVVLALRRLGLKHGKFGIFHRVDGPDDGNIVFSVASLVEPGSFDLTNLRQQRLPGVSMFMVLPGPKDGPEAFDEMMQTARALADTLDGELFDEAGSSMSIQRERFLREEIIQYQHGLGTG
ncbi:MAG: cell division protein ZipA [Gammaproteobacteria bacterium]|jgi:cell division protein ZipA